MQLSENKQIAQNQILTINPDYKAMIRRKYIGWFFLLISFGIGLITLYKGQFIDEADNLVTGKLILDGCVLYRDVFSHHFPFPYYWVAAVLLLFGKSIIIARLSIWMFQIATLMVAARLSGYHLTMGISALIWSLLRAFYAGNLVLYSVFSGISLFLVFIIVLAIIQDNVTPGWNHCVVIGCFSLIAIFSDPLSVYAVFIAMLFLFFKTIENGIRTSLIILSGVAIYAVYLVFTGTFGMFWDSVILFNIKFYGRYTPTNALRIKEFKELAIRFLGITDPALYNFQFFKPLAHSARDFENWFFTVFFTDLPLFQLSFSLH